MPKCSLCNKKVKETFRCKECGTKFCKNCGNVVAEMCVDCTEYDIEEKRQEELDILDDIQSMEQEHE